MNSKKISKIDLKNEIIKLVVVQKKKIFLLKKKILPKNFFFKVKGIFFNNYFFLGIIDVGLNSGLFSLIISAFFALLNAKTAIKKELKNIHQKQIDFKKKIK